jgi:hypothetical protein
MKTIDTPDNSEAAILARVIQPELSNLSAAAARALLKLRFTADDRQRMHELVVKNQSGALSAAEKRDLESYVRVGRLIDLLAAKARLALKKRGISA